MAVVNPPGWLENAGPTHTAAQLRTYVGGLLSGTFSAASNLRPRGGIHPSMGGSMVVTQTGTPSMGVNVDSGIAAISGSENSTQGVYWVLNDAIVTVGITTAHATLPRIDIIQVRVRDAFYSGVDNNAIIDAKAGTPAASPVAPTPDANALVLAEVLVGAGVTSITNANITDKRKYYSGVGGVISVPSESDLTDFTTTTVSEGQLIWTNNTNKLFVFDGSTTQLVWQAVAAQPIGSFVFATKSSDTVRSNTATPTNDPELSVALIANAVYIIQGTIISSRDDDTNDSNIRVGWSFPSGAMIWMGSHATSQVGVTDTDGPGEFGALRDETGVSPTGNFDYGLPDSSTTRAVSIIVSGLIDTSATAGNLALQWSPDIVSTTPVRVGKGSWIKVTRVQ